MSAISDILAGPHIKTLLPGPGPRYIEVEPLRFVAVRFVAVRRSRLTGNVQAVRKGWPS